MRGVFKDYIYTKFEDENQKLKMAGGAWSINLDDLPDEAVLIEYVTPTNRYVINRYDAFKHGFERVLAGERKLIVPLRWWQEGSVAIND